MSKIYNEFDWKLFFSNDSYHSCTNTRFKIRSFREILLLILVFICRWGRGQLRWRTVHSSVRVHYTVLDIWSVYMVIIFITVQYGRTEQVPVISYSPLTLYSNTVLVQLLFLCRSNVLYLDTRTIIECILRKWRSCESGILHACHSNCFRIH